LLKELFELSFYENNDCFQDVDVGDESGWKQVHGDVFRAPSNLILFSSLVGTGHQLAVLIFCVIGFSLLGTLYTKYDSFAAILTII
jgi:transmembrane 9 superfamily protein 3